MDYKKKYENALEWARQVINGECGFIRKEVEEVFPELKESEDDRIRKGLIKAVSGTLKGNTLFGTDITREEALSWLEKQGEQNYEFHGIAESRPTKGTLKKLVDEIENVDNANKVEPKFKIGQRIKQGDTIAEIKEISEDGYHCDIAFVPFTAEDNWELSLWDENDDKLLYECKKEIWKSAPTMLSLKHEKIEQWLESLKQRIQRQGKEPE